MDVKSRKYDVLGRTEIVEHDMNTTTGCWRITMIDDLQVVNFDALDILQKDNVLYGAFAIEPGQSARSVPTNDDRIRTCSRTHGLQLTDPGLIRLEDFQSIAGRVNVCY